MGNFILREILRRLKGNKRGFTLIELIVVLGCMLILSTIAMYLYRQGLAYAKGTVCQTNLKALHKAILLYSEENDAFPATLGDLKLKHLEKGYAEVMDERGWLIKVSTFLIKLEASDHAYAQFLTYENLKAYGAGKNSFRCPADHNGGVSYGINGNLEGKKLADISDYMIVVADSDHAVFYTLNELSQRHSHRALAVNKDGTLMMVEGNKIVALLKDKPGKSTEDPVEDDLPSTLEESIDYFDDLVNNNPDSTIADKAEDIRNKLLTALNELSESLPDLSAAQGNIAEADEELQTMIDGGLIDADKGSAIRDLFHELSTQDPNEPKVTICHQPGTKHANTLSVSESSLSAHLAHGDKIGECREEDYVH